MARASKICLADLLVNLRVIHVVPGENFVTIRDGNRTIFSVAVNEKIISVSQLLVLLGRLTSGISHYFVAPTILLFTNVYETTPTLSKKIIKTPQL